MIDRDLLVAVENGDLERLMELIEKGADALGIKTDEGYTLLHWASYYGHKDIVKYLIEIGANVNTTSIDGKTPIYWAKQNGHREVVDLLIHYGANNTEDE
jgi:ankyrin repeat protein